MLEKNLSTYLEAPIFAASFFSSDESTNLFFPAINRVFSTDAIVA